MGLITFGGLGSGLDVNSIIDALVKAEKAPLQFSLDRQEATIQLTLSGLGSLKSALADVRSAAFSLNLTSNFNQRTVKTSSSEFFSATANSSALVGGYAIEVKNLAAGTELSSQVFTGGATTTFGAGTLTFTRGSETFDVAVGATDTLQDIRNNINAATDNIGVNVNLLNNVTVGPDTGSLLTLKSNVTGTGNDLVVTFSGDPSLANLSTNLNTDKPAADANLALDGFNISSSSNTFTDVLDGVTITAKKANAPTETSTLTIAKDTASVKTKITDFVDAFNGYLDVARQLGQTTEGDQGLLVGDYTLRQVSGVLRGLLSQTASGVSGDFNSLSAIGITTLKNGSLELNTSTLDAALANNFDQFDELFTGTTGIADRFVKTIDQYSGSNGSISLREQGLNSQLGRIADQRIAQDYRIAQLEIRLREQFAAMDIAVAQFNSTGAFLTQQIANLPGFGNSKKD
jgi:flagellar hook-associated protein 2